MKTRVNICLIARKKDRAGSRIEKTPTTPCYLICRLTVYGQKARVLFHVPHEVQYGQWDANAQRAKGRGQAERLINEQLTKLRDKLTDLWADLERQGRPITANAIYRAYKANGSSLDMLSLYEAFVEERRTLVGVEISKGSLEVAVARRTKLTEFLSVNNLQGLRPEEFTHNMADKFLYWSLQEKGHKRNYANKMLQTISQALRWGVRREYLTRNPMDLYQYKAAQAAEIKYLTLGEIGVLRAAQLPDYLARTRDCFLFQCWTGLAYADLAALDVARDAEYRTDAQGTLRRLLRVRRQKSTMHHGYECVIPLLPEAERLLGQYEDELPAISNQVYNRYLKEIGELCGFSADKMTSHVGRKTAGVLMLNMGIRMEVVSKFLGHSSVRMTEKVYAKILDTTLTSEFDRVFTATAVNTHTPLQFAPAPVVLEVFEPAQVVGHAPRKQPKPVTRKAKKAKEQAITGALAPAPAIASTKAKNRPAVQFEMLATW